MTKMNGVLQALAYVHAKSEVHAIIDRYIDMIETQSATEVQGRRLN